MNSKTARVSVRSFFVRSHFAKTEQVAEFFPIFASRILVATNIIDGVAARFAHCAMGAKRTQDTLTPTLSQRERELHARRSVGVRVTSVGLIFRVVFLALACLIV